LVISKIANVVQCTQEDWKHVSLKFVNKEFSLDPEEDLFNLYSSSLISCHKPLEKLVSSASSLESVFDLPEDNKVEASIIGNGLPHVVKVNELVVEGKFDYLLISSQLPQVQQILTVPNTLQQPLLPVDSNFYLNDNFLYKKPFKGTTIKDSEIQFYLGTDSEIRVTYDRYHSIIKSSDNESSSPYIANGIDCQEERSFVPSNIGTFENFHYLTWKEELEIENAKLEPVILTVYIVSPSTLFKDPSILVEPVSPRKFKRFSTLQPSDILNDELPILLPDRSIVWNFPIDPGHSRSLLIEYLVKFPISLIDDKLKNLSL